jgi:hypothetical protein
MMQDTRRYHRGRRPIFTRAYGALGALASMGEAAGSAIGSAAGAVGSGLESAAGSVGSGLESAASSVGSGVESLFTGGGGGAGSGAAAPAAGATPTLGSVGSYLLNRATGGVGSGATSALGNIGHGIQSLFGTGPDDLAPGLAGPPAPTGPGFLSGIWQGFTHDAPSLVHPSAGTSLGRGLGQTATMLDQLNAQGGVPIPPLPAQPVIRIPTGSMRPFQQAVPAMSATPATGPVMSLLKVFGSL